MTLLRKTMSAEFGVIRTPDGMLSGLKTILQLEAENTSPRFQNALVTAKSIAVFAIMRRESRGGHYRTDYPQDNPDLAKRSFLSYQRVCDLAMQLVNEDQAASAQWA